MCKADYIQCVKEILSTGGRGRVREPASPWILERLIASLIAMLHSAQP
jgi:hypothetical protein